MVPRPVLTAIHPGKKVSDEDWNVLKSLYEAGESAGVLAEKYGIKPSTIHSRSSKQRWATPQRITRAKSLELVSSDPASAVADLWARRKGESRESVYQGAKKALDRFFAMAPVPQSFSEAAIAEKMLSKAIDPEVDQDTKGNINLAILTTTGFAPRPIVDV